MVRGNGKVIRSIDVGETPFFEFPSCVQEEGYTVRLHSPQTQLVLNKAFAVDSKNKITILYFLFFAC